MKPTHRLDLAVLALSCLAFANGANAGDAKIWEETITLPSYTVAPPDPNPRFYSGRTYQGAKATFYPYPVSDQMIEERADRNYQAVCLENPYIRISVLPELGGRIFTATDKTDGYDFFYRQHVIKPALIGMLGAWISGGVEWNVPHHHRATSFMPVDYVTQTNSTGSVTVWVGETEWRHRMRWVTGLTVYPDRNYIEMTMKLVNRTPVPNPVLFWINPAVHANENYQVIFPPDAEWAAQHAKPEFASWPIAHQRYGGNDYTRGVDISWWKNHSSPVSFFCFHSDENFFGGYDHGKHAGVVHYADHFAAPGKKFFEWGNGSEGEMWTKVLSDEDGAYLELMAGAWSDNQPDYSWLQPQQTREWKHYWYPVRNLPGLKAATLDGAADLVVSNSVAKIALNATKEFKGATARLQVGDKVVMEQKIDISPALPFSANVTVDSGLAAESLRVSLTSADGRELVSYQPKPPKNTPMPKPVERPKAPKDYASTDELYFTGQRIEQLWSPSFEAEPYYQEMLRRDAGDSRANTALGILRCRQWRWAEAETFLQKGIDRATANYIRPKDVEAFYYLGTALREQGKLAAACDAFELAAWSPAWEPSADVALAEIHCREGRYSLAEERIDRSLRIGNSINPKALALKSIISRTLGHQSDALAGLKRAQQFDPLDPLVLNELIMANDACAPAAKQQLTRQLRDNPQALLEMAADYAAAGYWQDAANILRAAVEHADKSPLIRYSLAYYSEKAGQPNNPYYQQASELTPDLCFPHRFEEEAILRRAVEVTPTDGLASYYLGCLLYDNQPRTAMAAWEQSVKRNQSLALAHRNLAIAYAQVDKNPTKSVQSLETALELTPKEPAFYQNYTRLLYELDTQYEAASAPLQKRLDTLLKNRAATMLRDDGAARLISLLTAADQVDDALQILRQHHFHNWEGSSGLHDIYVDACLRHGIDCLRASKPADALKDFQAALEYPFNQEVGKPNGEHRVAQIYYLIGQAQEALGDKPQATAAFEKAASAWEGNASEGRYFKGLALRKNGKEEDASKIFEDLIKQGETEISRAEGRAKEDEVDYFAKFGEKRSERQRAAQGYYLTALGHLGQNKPAEANTAFAKALELNPAHLGALTWKQ